MVACHPRYINRIEVHIGSGINVRPYLKHNLIKWVGAVVQMV
jgi:hypothetical protein